jgi:hypothetical protein
MVGLLKICFSNNYEDLKSLEKNNVKMTNPYQLNCDLQGQTTSNSIPWHVNGKL